MVIGSTPLIRLTVPTLYNLSALIIEQIYEVLFKKLF
jgi:hypothetical protein